MNKFLKCFVGVVFIIAVLFVIFFLWFNRDPKRIVPENSSVISPADGVIIDIRQFSENDFAFLKKGTENTVSLPDEFLPAQAVVIEMNIHNIHVQRAPISGIVTHQEYIPGAFANAIFNTDKRELFKENEKMITIIENDETWAVVVQVAGFVARRIQSDIEVGEFVHQGDRIGNITLGSQVVLIIPESHYLNVSQGQRVFDTLTTIVE